mgnify:CR=1 FL=1
MVLLTGCVSVRDPRPSDTKFKDSDRDWVEIYRNEISIAIENEDREAYYFFVQELAKEVYKRQHGRELSPNPSIQILR